MVVQVGKEEAGGPTAAGSVERHTQLPTSPVGRPELVSMLASSQPHGPFDQLQMMPTAQYRITSVIAQCFGDTTRLGVAAN